MLARCLLSLAKVKYIVERWRLDYNHRQPHCRLSWQNQAVFAATRVPLEHTQENIGLILTELGA